MAVRTQVFVSYSHADSDYLQRLKVHLRPYERHGLVDVWSDARIQVGQHWKKQIEAALGSAAVAVLLISADFLASDFIADNELPPLLSAARDEGVVILPVVLKPCAFSDSPDLATFQAVNDPKAPLIALDEAEREQLWAEIARTVRDAVERGKTRPAHETIGITSLNEDNQILQFLDADLTDSDSSVMFMHTYQYHHLDFLSLAPPIEEAISASPQRDALIRALKKKFQQAGWEGDGELRVLWLPPFVGAGMEDTWGQVVYLVKQFNNGTSFLASPVPLPFGRLLAQQH